MVTCMDQQMKNVYAGKSKPYSHLFYLLPFTFYLRTFCLLLVVFLIGPLVTHAQGSSPDDLLKQIGFDQRLDAQVPLDLSLVNEAGQQVKLGDYLGSKPVILDLGYYQCPMLCPLVRDGLLDGLQNVPFNVGDQFQVVMVSIDPHESPGVAASEKARYIGRYARAGADAGWHFLTAPQDSIARLAQSVGFRYAYDPAQGQYAHAAGVVMLTPAGRVARYLYGLEFSARDLRLGLVEASTGTIGSPVDQVLLRCFHYDPVTGKYTLVVMRVIQLASLGAIAIVCMFLGVMFRRELWGRVRSDEGARVQMRRGDEVMRR